MTGDDAPFTRRRVLALAGASTAAFAAGCLGSDESDDSGSTDATSWDDVDEIYLDADTADGFVGVEPALIEGDSNPTLTLYEGREYEVTWENVDGAPHNFLVRDEEDRRLEGTEDETEEGATLTLTFEATAEMVSYVCSWHESTMEGEIEVRSE